MAAPAELPKDMLAELQNRVSAKTVGDGRAAAFDPTQWIPLFTALTNVLSECVKNRQAKGSDKAEALKKAREGVADVIANPSIINRLRLHRELVVELGRPAAKKIGQKFTDAVFDVGREAKREEILALLEEVTGR